MAGIDITERQIPGAIQSGIKKTCTVADRFYEGSFAGHWSSQEIEEEEGAQQLESLMTDLEALEFQPGEDQWQCILDSSGAYSVGALRHKFEEHLNLHRHLPSYKWHKISPIKVNCFIWTAIQNRIPSAKALKSRGLDSISTSCGACVAGEEDCDHLLITCPYAIKIREYIFDWCGIPQQQFQTVADLLSFVQNWGNNQRTRQCLITICHSLLWCLWNLRNDRIFNGRFKNTSRGADDVKTMAFFWHKHRGKHNLCQWDEWKLPILTFHRLWQFFFATLQHSIV